jgi:hypothetical protein
VPGGHLKLLVHVHAPQRLKGLSAAVLKGRRTWLREWAEEHGLVPFREQHDKHEPAGAASSWTDRRSRSQARLGPSYLVRIGQAPPRMG